MTLMEAAEKSSSVVATKVSASSSSGVVEEVG